jgi:hypothetical protein
VTRFSRKARLEAIALKEGTFAWPEPVTVKVADITDETLFPNIAKARRWAAERDKQGDGQ